MDEIGAVTKGLNDLFRGDATLTGMVQGVFWDQAKPEQPMPYVIFSLNNSNDYGAIGGGGKRTHSAVDITIKAITLGNSIAEASTIYQRIDALLTNYKANVVLNGDIIFIGTMQRISPISYTEQDAGKRYNHHGGLYRFFVNQVG